MNRSYRHQLWLALWWLSAASLISTEAFAPTLYHPQQHHHLPRSRTTTTTTTDASAPSRHHHHHHHHHQLNYSNRDASYEGSRDSSHFDEIESNILRNRLQSLHVQALDKLACRPPHPALSPTQFVDVFLKCLWENSDPLPDSGFRLLLAASTKGWREQLYHSVGAPLSADEETVASALGEALGRPHNQFGILVGSEDGEDCEYVATFPSDPLEYAEDGTAWVECQLRDATDDTLLATTGWQLQKVNDAWLVDSITWQDFRDEYRPGIGREEWMRICG